MGLFGRLDQGRECGVESTTAPGVVRDGCLIGDGVFDGSEGSRGVPGALSVEKSKGHDTGVVCDPRDPKAVVADGCDRAGNMSAVTIGVVGDRVVLDEVPPMDIVNEAVAVIIDPVGRDLTGVDPDVGCEVRMIGVYSAVDHRNDYWSERSGQFPRRLGVDAVGVEEAPKRPCLRVIGRCDLHSGVELHRANRRVRLKSDPGLVEVGHGFEEVEVSVAEALDEGRVGLLHQGVDSIGVGLGVEGNEEREGVAFNVAAVLQHGCGIALGIASVTAERKAFVVDCRLSIPLR